MTRSMRYFFTIIFALAYSIPTFSMDSIIFDPIIKTGKKWVLERRNNFEEDNISCYSQTIKFDTIVCGKSCYALEFEYLDDKLKDTSTHPVIHDNYVYEENGIVYAYINDLDKFEPVIDINGQIGQSFYSDTELYNFTTTVKDTNTITLCGKERKVLTVNNNTHWIEGIGSPENMFMVLIQERIGDYRILKYCYEGDECIFDYEEYNRTMTGITDQDITEPIINKLYDLKGTEVNYPKKGNIYVDQQGKKTIF